MSEYIVRMPPSMPYEIRVELNAWYVESEPIVRCRDCKHFRIEPWDEVLAAQYGAPPMICERNGDMDDVGPDGFCAWGERMES